MPNFYSDYIQARKIDSNIGELNICGEIYRYVFHDDEGNPITISASEIKKQLDTLKGIKTLLVNINSVGGSMDEGIEICNAILDFKKENSVSIVTDTRVAMSMASVIMQVGDIRKMRDNGICMIHKPLLWLSGGNADDLRKDAEVLDKYEERILPLYMRNFKGSLIELKELLKNETYFTAKEAFEIGFCNEIITPAKVEVNAKNMIFDGVKYGYEVVALYSNIHNNYQKKEGINSMANNPYNEKLKDYGITQAIFDTFDVSADVVMKVAAVMDEKLSERIKAESKVGNIITKEQWNNICGADKTSADIISMLKSHDDIKAKSELYEKIRTAKITETIASGVRAMGENFKSDYWNALLNKADIDFIDETKKQWDIQAKANIPSGRNSDPNASDGNGNNDKNVTMIYSYGNNNNKYKF